MSGRFFSIGLLMSAAMLIRQVQNLDRTVKMAFLAVIVFLGFVAPVPSFSVPVKRNIPTDDYSGVGDEQAWYFPYSGLANWGRDHSLPDSGQEWVKLGRQLRDEGEVVYVGKGIGYLGYYAGPKVHIIDMFGIADPLLARLPATTQKAWRIGHFKRDVPLGYVQTFRDKQNDLKDASLVDYYDHLSLIIRGPLWSLERWQAIWKINTGQYDYLIDSYVRGGARQEGGD